MAQSERLLKRLEAIPPARPLLRIAAPLLRSPVWMERLSYLFFGVCTTIVDTVVFFVLATPLRVDYRVANALAWAAAVVFAFFTNKKYVFRSDAKGRGLWYEFFSFLAARVASLLVDMGWMILAVGRWGMEENVANIFSNVVVVIANYFFSKFVVFRKEKEKEKEEEKGGGAS